MGDFCLKSGKLYREPSQHRGFVDTSERPIKGSTCSCLWQTDDVHVIALRFQYLTHIVRPAENQFRAPARTPSVSKHFMLKRHFDV